MSKDFEYDYIEPTQEHVGQMVEVSDSDTAWRERRLRHVFTDGIGNSFVCENIIDTNNVCAWKFARIRFRLPYAERQARCGIKVGDWVRVTRKAESYEDGWSNEWWPDMDAVIGSIFKVVDKNNNFGIRCDKTQHYVPYFVLEKVEPPASKPKVRTVADLEDGEVICTEDGEWLQVLPRTGERTRCDRESFPHNAHNKGWIEATFTSNYPHSNRPARLLHPPEFAVESLGKMVICVARPEHRYVVKEIYCREEYDEPKVNIGGGEKIILGMRLSELRVIE